MKRAARPAVPRPPRGTAPPNPQAGAPPATRAGPKPTTRPATPTLRTVAEARIATQGTKAAPPGRTPQELMHELQVHQIELEMQNDELRRSQHDLEVARDRYLALYDLAPVGYLSLDDEGVVTEANLTAETLLDEAREQLVGRSFARLVAPDDGDRWYLFRLALSRQGGPGHIEVALKTRSGSGGLYVQIAGRRVATAGTPPVLRITLTDLTERKRSEAELRIAATAFETQEGIMITDRRGVIVRVNKAFSQITGYSAEEAVGQTGRLMRSGRHEADFYTAMWETLQRDGFWQGEVWNRRKDGELYPQWLTITAVRGEGPAVRHYVGTMLDISQRKSREEEIAQLAFYDPLTGLPNRRLMKDRLHLALAASARTGRESALMFIDLDQFKRINDTLGHDLGDQLLQQVARRLAACTREGDTVARLGGDEFVVMLAADLADSPSDTAALARLVGEKILAALNRPYEIDGRECHCSASIGITLLGGHHSTVDELLRRADQAMYQAKASGRNALRFFDTRIQEGLLRRAMLESELRQALRANEFVLHYQPIVDAAQRLLGAEALLRWQHPRRGLVLPGEFIAVAEETGLIHPLGLWALEAACQQLAEWQRDPAMAGLSLAVNISARQFREPQFTRQVREVLRRTGADPTRLKLELTESMMLDDVEDTIGKMNALKSSGVGFSLDDFGTGYASLAYLKRLPLDQLKIDKSFVPEVGAGPHEIAITRAIVDLGRSLGLTVIAEGVETEAQRESLAGYGCHVFQGNLFGQPGPAEALRQRAHAVEPAAD